MLPASISQQTTPIQTSYGKLNHLEGQKIAPNLYDVQIKGENQNLSASSRPEQTQRQAFIVQTQETTPGQQ